MLSVMKQSRWLLALAVVLFVGQAFGHGMSEAEKLSIIEGGNLRYMWLGATHMLSGYDHLLFVVLQQLHCEFFLDAGEFGFSTTPMPS